MGEYPLSGLIQGEDFAASSQEDECSEFHALNSAGTLKKGTLNWINVSY
jgi:hypothetical protein